MAKKLTQKKVAKLQAKTHRALKMLEEVIAECREYNPEFTNSLHECLAFSLTDAEAALQQALMSTWDASEIMYVEAV